MLAEIYVLHLEHFTVYKKKGLFDKFTNNPFFVCNM